MKKVIITAAALAALSSSVFAAPAAGNPGTITFNGEIVAGACGISGDTLDQTVNLGQVPAGDFTKVGDRSQATPVTIVLTDCDTTTAKNAYFTFTGTSDGAVPGLFAVTGSAGNVGIRLQTSAGEYLDNGAEQKSAIVLSNGNNTVRFGAMYESTQATVTPGVADSVANFTVRYQ
ncbi:MULTISPECIES: fimbrial protein [unclassified Paraburkholderia]|uniref:fimbrial protein n=1 Tax=unclassified Paraburkholderia TaxID=2615204 RepID=UPI001611B40B|nr:MULTISPECIES: fimbrial protein [unclassified Paraburkholderia]MBB5445121.1 major type 1 subunit fimbrin (pilin) [Paraburkholderia sp. WSM4177]MBB5485669.1 major type 1 subunit fimbrin (pilin) [Paraburkholderia sp. WSM4180]